MIFDSTGDVILESICTISSQCIVIIVTHQPFMYCFLLIIILRTIIMHIYKCVYNVIIKIFSNVLNHIPLEHEELSELFCRWPKQQHTRNCYPLEKFQKKLQIMSLNINMREIKREITRRERERLLDTMIWGDGINGWILQEVYSSFQAFVVAFSLLSSLTHTQVLKFDVHLYL